MNARIADFVATSLTGLAADYDIDAITAELVDTYGHDVDLQALEATEYWAIIQGHDTAAQNTVTISEPGQLHHQYPGQDEPQDCYVQVDLPGQSVAADYNPEPGNAVPAQVFHGLVRRYPIPALTGEAAAELLEQIRPLAERLVADWTQVYDGSNLVAVLGGQAAAAEHEIEQICAGAWGDETAQVIVCGLEGATTGEEAEEYGITAQTTDERLAQIEEDIRQVLVQGYDTEEVVLEGVDEYLEQLRQEAAEEDEDA